MALGQMLLLLNPCQEFLPKQRRSARSALGGGGPHRSQRPLNPRNELGLPTNTTNRVAMTNRNHVSPLWRLQVQDRGAAGGSAEGLCWVWTAGSSLCLQRCTLRAHGIMRLSVRAPPRSLVGAQVLLQLFTFQHHPTVGQDFNRGPRGGRSQSSSPYRVGPEQTQKACASASSGHSGSWC